MKKIPVLLLVFLFQLQYLCSKEPARPDTKPLIEFRARGDLPDFFSGISRGDSLKVAYLGRSITAQEGWLLKSMDLLKIRSQGSTGFVHTGGSATS